jgi:hypothetical protein
MASDSEKFAIFAIGVKLLYAGLILLHLCHYCIFTSLYAFLGILSGTTYCMTET